MKRPLITLLTDFGTRDHYVAAMKGVILGICPAANIVDITHEIPPFQIAAGAYTLAQAAAAFPHGTIHVAVVDPGVGGPRRPLAARANRQTFLGPDNGLLAMVLQAASRASVYEITNTNLFNHPVSRTFHGRDIFAPVAAHLARGLAISRTGIRCYNWREGQALNNLQTGPNEWTGQILSTDRFGNLITSLAWRDFSEVSGRPFQIRLGSLRIGTFADTYDAAPPSAPFLIRGSGDLLEISVREGSAAASVPVSPGAPVVFRWR